MALITLDHATDDNVLYVDAASDDADYSLSMVEELVFIGSGIGGFGIEGFSQTWDGSSWPTDPLAIAGADPVFLEATIDHQGNETEVPRNSEAHIYGAGFLPNMLYGAGFGLDFDLVLQPKSFVTLHLEPDRNQSMLHADVGDAGFALTEFRLYSRDLDANDPGGFENPYWADGHYLSAPPATPHNQFYNYEFYYTFQNDSDLEALTYHLRFEGNAFVGIVPEPATAALLTVGGAAAGLRRRRRQGGIK